VIILARHEFNDENSVNITPLIDILFILLLFFILTSTFDVKDEKSIEINLPEVSTGKVMESDELFTITVNSENEIYHKGKILSIEDIRDFIDKNRNDIDSANILADEKASHGTVMKVLDLFREEKIYNVNIEVLEK